MLSRKLFLLCLIGFMVGMTVADSAPAAENNRTSFTTPLLRYEDWELSLGDFFYYTRVANDKLRSLNRFSGEERKKLIDQTIRDVVFEHMVMRDAEKGGFMEDPEYTTHIPNMNNDWLTRLYEYHQFSKDYQPNEEDLKKKYEEQKEDFFQKQQYSFRHIFCQTIDRSEKEQQKAHANAQKAIALIKAGSDFVKVAELYSDSARKGNLIGPVTPAKYKPEKPLNPIIENALLLMKPGDISGIIKTKYGYEILKLESMTPERYKPLETVKSKLTNELKKIDFDKFKKELIEKHWDKAVKEYHPELIFQEDAQPDAVLFTVYGHPFTMTNYKWLKGSGSIRRKNESDEDYRQRQIDFLKNTLIYRSIVGKLARDLGYDKIPYFQIITKAQRSYRMYLTWINRLWKKYKEQNPVTEVDKHVYYDSHKDRFKEPQAARIKEMTFHLPPHNKEVLYEVKKAQDAVADKAAKALKRVQDGEDFATVAKQMSESDSAAKGGDIGLINADSDILPRSVAIQAIRLATGEICQEPIQSGDSYYIVKCLEKPEPAYLPFDNPDVQRRVENGVLNQIYTLFLNDMKKRMVVPDKIKILFEEIYTFDPNNLERPSLDPPTR